ncbi:hypothetical protein [Candidatus Soleaferrea massiliensis]|uniref:hypothetical protein n=1 Tax=Candidatus Soleaferrea massiliensis TaxID=1470354 RepID=UPI00058BFE3B|nr:hypothetical protein [Candidatus Soleaferrea massiliensis]
MRDYFKASSEHYTQDFSILLEQYIEQEITDHFNALEQKNQVYKESCEKRNQILDHFFDGDPHKQLQLLRELDRDIRRTEIMEAFLLGFDAAQRTTV